MTKIVTNNKSKPSSHKSKRRSYRRHRNTAKRVTRRVRRQRTQIRTGRLGGKVIGTGSYGCVFSPPLKCEGASSRPNSENVVTKLMETDDAFQEDKEIQRVIERVKSIPDYERYTLLSGIHLCDPDIADITDEDIRGKSCPRVENLKKGVYDRGAITLVQMPKGGLEIGEYLKEGLYKDKKGIIEFVSGMNDLLTRFIVPMNEKGVYHQDIKDQNILVDSHNQSQLIDWGFTVFNDDGERPITSINDSDNNNDNWFHRFIMYNEPLSVAILLSPKDSDDPSSIEPSSIYNRYASGKLTKDEAFKIATSYFEMLDPYNNLPDHIEHLFEYVYMAVSNLRKSGYIGKEITYETVIRDYVYRLCEHYTITDENNGRVKRRLNVEELFKDFYHNMDLWGWAMSFSPILAFRQLKGMNVDESNIVMTSVAKLIIYLFTDGAIVIDPIRMTDIMKDVVMMGSPLPASPTEDSGDSQDTVVHHTPKTRGGKRKSITQRRHSQRQNYKRR